jgi:hypothetical protein
MMSEQVKTADVKTMTQVGGTRRNGQEMWCRYLLHVVGLVGGVGVNIVRHGADLPLLHDLDATEANIVSINSTRNKEQ